MSIESQPAPAVPAGVDQDAAWNGPEGTAWAEHSSRRPVDGDLVTELLDAADLRSGDRVLDVGCGTGALTRRAAARVDPAVTLGIDLSAEMIEEARRAATAEGPANARFVVGDAQVAELGSRSYARVLSHFGVMFFSDPVAAFRNLAAALRPDGRLLFVCPQEMDSCAWYLVPLAALLGRSPRPEDAPSVMFDLADPRTTTRILVAAGLRDVRLTPVVRSLWFGADAQEAATAFLGSGPARAFLERNPSMGAEEARQRLEAAVTPFASEDGIRIPGSHWLVEARPGGEP